MSEVYMFKFWNNLTLIQKVILWFLNLPILIATVFICYILYEITGLRIFDNCLPIILLFNCGMYSLFLFFITYNKYTQDLKQFLN